jgi:UDP-galactopyranose mutase
MTVYSYEFSRECSPGDVPYYPVQLSSEDSRFKNYVDIAKDQTKMSFVGRLGTFRYIDMDVAIREALDAGTRTIEAVRMGNPIPPFFVQPSHASKSSQSCELDAS